MQPWSPPDADDGVCLGVEHDAVIADGGGHHGQGEQGQAHQVADRVVLVLNNPVLLLLQLQVNILISVKISATHQTSEVSKTDLVHGGKEIVVQHAPHSSPHVHLGTMFEMLRSEEYL